ncbi:hypothetical protein HO133_009549 [Letharia lupina]|uniref:Uncharacterized protein n=1 Tax=Letharia lupina TaxID=560253 RepID=A0A8H6CLP3_9LECA|nr:uncharacterized protein HO133_009549 [Letharia lupina]KAF6225549.1 hypothetical protein HO133_009549 [Letharia lupina]
MASQPRGVRLGKRPSYELGPGPFPSVLRVRTEAPEHFEASETHTLTYHTMTAIDPQTAPHASPHAPPHLPLILQNSLVNSSSAPSGSGPVATSSSSSVQYPSDRWTHTPQAAISPVAVIGHFSIMFPPREVVLLSERHAVVEESFVHLEEVCFGDFAEGDAVARHGGPDCLGGAGELGGGGGEAVG